ncbi:MAG: pantoate--beta-alanine ligase [Pedobacter sp.]|nr:MAG: pantoate--beta-alanine ligase [Pedobacter sp.]
MEIIQTQKALQESLSEKRSQGAKIALVPTMGALHNGHISLIQIAQQQADLVVCSIFVNPTQFTDPKDLEKYPRPLEHDIKMLEQVGCSIVFMPSVLEMYPQYPKAEDWAIDLGPAEFLLEGEYRKGHYQGVTQIVKKLFDAVDPDFAYFGQKDFQQVMMIRNMVERLALDVKIVMCPIVREPDGLAMSSRNIHLTNQDRQNALVLSEALQFVKDNYQDYNLEDLLAKANEMIGQKSGVELDYFVIADPKTLYPLTKSTKDEAIALVAAKVGTTRLIDNMLIG